MITFINGIINEKGWASIWMPAAHFALSATVGLLVYWLILTILLRGQFGIYLMAKQSTQRGFSIHQFSLLVALCSSVVVHILEDYTLNIF